MCKKAMEYLTMDGVVDGVVIREFEKAKSIVEIYRDMFIKVEEMVKNNPDELDNFIVNKDDVKVIKNYYAGRQKPLKKLHRALESFISKEMNLYGKEAIIAKHYNLIRNMDTILAITLINKRLLRIINENETLPVHVLILFLEQYRREDELYTSLRY